MDAEFGAAAGATDIAGQRAVLPAWRGSEGTGDCPGQASALGDGISVPTLRLSDRGSLQSKSTVRTSARLGSSFLGNPGWDSRRFHLPEADPPGFSHVELCPIQISGGCRSNYSPGRVCSHPVDGVLEDFVELSGCSV